MPAYEVVRQAGECVPLFWMIPNWSRLAGISRGALNNFMGNAFAKELRTTQVNGYATNGGPDRIEEVANGVVHPVTKETITKYQKLFADPLLKEVWSETMAKELRRLAQGYGNFKGIDTIIRFGPRRDTTHTQGQDGNIHTHTIAGWHAYKEDPNRVQSTVGGNIISYPWEVTTRQADLTTSKYMQNSVKITPGAKYMGADASNIHLATPIHSRTWKPQTIPIANQKLWSRHNHTFLHQTPWIMINIRMCTQWTNCDALWVPMGLFISERGKVQIKEITHPAQLIKIDNTVSVQGPEHTI